MTRYISVFIPSILTAIILKHIVMVSDYGVSLHTDETLLVDQYIVWLTNGQYRIINKSDIEQKELLRMIATAQL